MTGSCGEPMFRKSTKPKTIDFWDTQITLLTLEQAQKLSRDILSCNESWWLCSPGTESDSLCCISNVGDIDAVGQKSESVMGVRPVFMLLNNRVRPGDKLYVGNIRCTTIGKNLALADKTLCGFACDENSYLKPEKQLSLFVENDNFVEEYIEGSA